MINHLLEDWWKIFSTNLYVIPKKSKGHNPLDYPFNFINSIHKGINNELSSLRSSNLVEFRWYRDIYFAILGLKRFSLELSPLGLKVNLENINTINKIDRSILFSKFELEQFIKLYKRKERNDLYNLKDFGYEFGSRIDKLYEKKYKRSKEKFDKRTQKIPKILNEK